MAASRCIALSARQLKHVPNAVEPVTCVHWIRGLSYGSYWYNEPLCLVSLSGILFIHVPLLRSSKILILRYFVLETLLSVELCRCTLQGRNSLVLLHARPGMSAIKIYILVIDV